MQFITISDPDESQINEIRHKLQEYNDPYWETKDKKRYLIEVLDDSRLRGGIVFTIFGQWLELDYFWVDPEERSRGLGGAILLKAESFARSVGCRKAFTNTFGFQALPFYKKKGYKVVYTQEGYPITNRRYFLEKDLYQKD